MSRSANYFKLIRLPLLAGAAILSTACASAPRPVSTPVVTAPVAVVAEPPATSVFDLKDMWYSAQAPAARLASLNGGLLVIGFVDRACEAACRSTIAAMRTIEHQTDYGVHFVLVARPGTESSPAALAAFAKTQQLPAGRFTVISSTEESIAKLVAILDVRGSGLTLGELESTSVLSVLDYNGVVVQQRGNGRLGPIVEALTLLANIR